MTAQRLGAHIRHLYVRKVHCIFFIYTIFLSSLLFFTPFFPFNIMYFNYPFCSTSFFYFQPRLPPQRFAHFHQLQLQDVIVFSNRRLIIVALSIAGTQFSALPLLSPFILASVSVACSANAVCSVKLWAPIERFLPDYQAISRNIWKKQVLENRRRLFCGIQPLDLV